MTVLVDRLSGHMSDSTTTATARPGGECRTTVVPAAVTNQGHQECSRVIGWNTNPAAFTGLFKRTIGPAACGAKCFLAHKQTQNQADARKHKAFTEFSARKYS